MKVGKLGGLSKLFPLHPHFLTSLTSSACFSSSLTALNPIKIFLFCYSSASQSKDCTETFRRFGFSDNEITSIFDSQPSLQRANTTILTSKLNLLLSLGLTSSKLVKIINRHPRFLQNKIDHHLNERIDVLHHLFRSKEVLLKAVIRNPSLLKYDHNHLKHCVSLYQGLGISKEDLGPLVISRPSMLLITSLSDEKLEYIQRFGLSNSSKIYKYLVSVIAVSDLDTIREKVANLEKFGLSDDEVMDLFGRSPLVLTLSIEKVQRNMTFVVGTLKLPATVILKCPFLLYANLESVLRPRYVIREKVRAMGLLLPTKIPDLLTTLRMMEARFLRAFIECHSKDIADDLMGLYKKVKAIKRLAETAKRSFRKGLPI